MNGVATARTKRGWAVCAALVCSVSASALLAESAEDRDLGRESRKERAAEQLPPAANDQPLSVIDWLGAQSPPENRPKRPPNPGRAEEPPVAKTALAPKVQVTPLGDGAPRRIGLVPGSVTGLRGDIWLGSDTAALIDRIRGLPDLHLPAAQALLYTVLLAEAQAPQGEARNGDELALARGQKLMELGALDPALSLIEQAGVTTSTAHFDLWMQLSLLTGTEHRVCERLVKAPHLTRDYGTRIFCNARAGNWENAALTFGSAQALGLLPQEQLELFDRFLNPDFYEGAEPLRVPRQMDPMTFRLFETIGEPLPSSILPRAYAVADLRDIAGWKAQLEAAERLTRAGALPDNLLLGLYTDRQPAASGGIWDRVAALQRFETALRSSSAEAVAKTLPPAWEAMREASLEVAFATLFAEPLSTIPLAGHTATLARDIALLSPNYEAAAARVLGKSREDELLRAVARGEAPAGPAPEAPLAAAVHDAFTNPAPRADLMTLARDKELGLAILRLLSLLHDGASGDTSALRDALATLRALGLEDTARRAALQIVLLQQ
ncbi:hypothetical protein OIHEL45_12180 [Sulfitobacter indolifex HEL-45]|uniref:Uncharacterized protein n=1 Tax=Sulfitobacter indolifex HEL-45 TaxID=391624 RepID=A0ABP2D9V5_9RHOB|nr:hypothetical protein OIHEL45_12180 [Sulfitobacter indolifex HEL-45]